jgi:hypothetical protein
MVKNKMDASYSRPIHFVQLSNGPDAKCPVPAELNLSNTDY